MKGSTGTSQTVVRILSGTKTATDLRQKRLKQATDGHFFNIYKVNGAAGAYRALKKMQRMNDLDRRGAHVQFWHTLVRGGTVPLRHQAMTAGQARKLNRFNQMNRLNLYWVMGRQKL